MFTRRLQRLGQVSVRSFSSTGILAQGKLAEEAHVLIRGFHPYSRRSDVLELLGPALESNGATLSACLHHMTFYPSGEWVVAVPASGDKADSKKFEDDFKDCVKKHAAANGFSCAPVSISDRKKLIVANDYDVDNATIRLERVDPDVSEDLLRYLFQNFTVRGIRTCPPDEITNWSKPKIKWYPKLVKPGKKPFDDYLVKFESAEHAQRAALIFQGIQVNQVGIMTRWYDI